MNQEAMELQAWYDSERYKYTQLEREVDGIMSNISVLQSTRDRLRAKIREYADKGIFNMKQAACLGFIDGTLTLPHTELKQRAAANGRLYLDSMAGTRGSTTGRMRADEDWRPSGIRTKEVFSTAESQLEH